MRLFGSDRITGIMDKIGLKEGEMIQHSMITKSIERAQRKVEENNFGIRKRLLEYDDVMNSQREVIYKKRRHALFGERVEVDILNTMYDVIENLVNEYQENGMFEEFNRDLIRLMSIELPVTEQDFMKMKPDDLIDKVYHEMVATYTRRMENIAKQAYPVIRDVYEQKSHLYTNIVVPISDGKHIFQIVTNLEKAYNNQGKELVKSYQKQTVLITIDDAWKEQLREMDDLKQSVQNASYEQKDPLLIYKFESFNLFKIMVTKVNKSIVSILAKGHIPISDPQQVHEGHERRGLDLSKLSTSKSEVPTSSSSQNRPEAPQEPKHVQPIRVEKRVGRNDPCPCGSGKKFKACHGKDMID
jgi:preprotein translocase subunit SecA